MLLSMTGFGKATCEIKNQKLTVEIKSLNSKQFDLSSRIPNDYREKELEIRNILANKLIRGKVDISIYTEVSNADAAAAEINADVVKAYYKQLNELAAELGIVTGPELLSTILRLPDAMKTNRNELDENDWALILKTIEDAADQLVAFRQQEGKALANDIATRIYTIQNLLSQVPQYERPRIDRIKERIKGDLEEFIKLENINRDRLEQEMIFYIEKLDINEEKVRLANHCKYFLDT
ncbi:MAG: hypothetical protein IKW77_10240, partial [Salinivirgaceae bacterium]|nr:hypothetical protein [Salinivirgaceae bacterium]